MKKRTAELAIVILTAVVSVLSSIFPRGEK